MSVVSLGPQGEPLFEARDVAVDGPGFGPTKVPTAAFASGTDREQAIKEFAASIIRGPQNEIILPATEQGVCPLCGADFPESCSEDGGQVSDPQQLLRDDMDDIDDPDNALVFDDRDNMFELLRGK